MCPVEKAIACAIQRHLASVSIPRALAAIDRMSNCDASHTGKSLNLAAVDRWHKALSESGTELADPVIMLEAMSELFESAASLVPDAPVPIEKRSAWIEMRDAVASFVNLAGELADKIDLAYGTDIWPTFMRRTDAMMVRQMVGMPPMAKPKHGLH